MLKSIKLDYVGRYTSPEMASTGTGRYFLELYKRLNPSLDIKVINYRIYKLPFYRNTISSKIYKFKVLCDHKGKIMHVLSDIDASKLYFMLSDHIVVTCHDMFSYIFPDYPVGNKSATQNIANAQKIIAISNSTKNDIIKYLKISPEKIRVIYQGVGDEFRPIPQDKNNALKKYFIQNERQIILYVGDEQPRKNLEAIIKAFYKLKKMNNNAIFVKVGKPRWPGSRERLKKLLIDLKLEKDVFFIDHVTFEELPQIYNTASLFVFPSLYEGFGIPPLEAMACGIPVITSNTSSLPEVAGDAAIMVDPYDINGLARSMYEVLTNDGLRKDMRKKGLERAKLFSWEKTARETLRVYEEIYEGL